MVWVLSQTEPNNWAWCSWGFSSDCRTKVEGGRCSSCKLLTPEGEVGGRRREEENLKPSSEDSGGALQQWPEKTSLSSPEDDPEPEVWEPRLARDKGNLEEEEQLGSPEQQISQVSICPQKGRDLEGRCRKQEWRRVMLEQSWKAKIRHQQPCSWYQGLGQYNWWTRGYRLDGTAVWQTKRRGLELGKCQGFMVGEKGKLVGFKKKTEMANGGVGGKEFSVKGGVLGFGAEKLLGEKRPGETT